MSEYEQWRMGFMQERAKYEDEARRMTQSLQAEGNEAMLKVAEGLSSVALALEEVKRTLAKVVKAVDNSHA